MGIMGILAPSEAACAAAGREERAFWAYDRDTYEIVAARAYGPPPGKDSDGYWWCPTLGFSGKENVHLFNAREDAVATAREELGTRIARLTAYYDKIE